MIPKLKKIFSLVMVLGGAAFVFWSLMWIVTHLDLQFLKRWFYTLVIPAIFFYVMRAVRAVALFFEAKAEAVKQQTSNPKRL